MIDKFIDLLFKKLTGRKPPLNWYLSDTTRQTIFVGCERVGTQYFKFENAASDPIIGEEQSYERREEFLEAVDELVRQIQLVASQDEWSSDPYFRASIFTRVDAYLKVDGVPGVQRKAIIRRVGKKLPGH